MAFAYSIQFDNPELIEYNRKTFKAYNVGDKVMIDDGDGRTFFGVVHGFAYNSVGEMVLYVNMIGMSEIRTYHPCNVKVI